MYLKLWFVHVLMAAVEHYRRQRKNNRNISKKRNIRDERERLQPADRNEYQHAKCDVG